MKMEDSPTVELGGPKRTATSTPSRTIPAKPPSPAGFDWSNIPANFPREQLLPSLPTAVLCWFLTIIFSVSLAALIFRGPLAPNLSLGIGMTLGTAIAVGLATTLTSSVPGCIAIPNDRTAPMLAILVGSIAASFAPGDPMMVPTCLSALLFATALNGMILWLLGHFKMGILVRFLPYPVVGGFMAGAGWLLVKGAFSVATGMEINLTTCLGLFHPDNILRWAPSLAIALTILLVSRRTKHYLVIPSIIIIGVAVFYAVNWITGLSLPRLREIGWLPAPFPTAVAWHPVSLTLIATTNWNMVATHVFTYATIGMVSAISMLMISSSLEISSKVEVDADRELQSAGLANFTSFLAGGVVGFHSLSLTILSLRIGPNSRWVGLFTAIATALSLFFAPNMVSYLPIPVISALLLYLGLNFLGEWLIDTYHRMRRTDYMIIVLILFVVAWAGYIIGVGVGLVMALTLFALRYSLIDVVRLELSGAQHRSNVDRTPAEIAVLRPIRPSIHILKLQGFIFFGTAYSLLQRVRARVHATELEPLRYLILDFRHVTGVDSSALLSLSRMIHIGAQSDFATLCTSVPPAVFITLKRDAIVREGFSFHPDVDHAVEWCETLELEARKAQLEPDPVHLGNVLEQAQPDRPEVVKNLARYFVPQQVAAGDILAIQGDNTRDLFLIQSGRVSALLKAANGEVIRLRTMGPGSVVGEIGLYLGKPRTASLIAETEGLVWRLLPETLTQMEREDPHSAAALHEILARMLASRLIQANELLEISLR